MAHEVGLTLPVPVEETELLVLVEETLLEEVGVTLELELELVELGWELELLLEVMTWALLLEVEVGLPELDELGDVGL